MVVYKIDRYDGPNYKNGFNGIKVIKFPEFKLLKIDGFKKINRQFDMLLCNVKIRNNNFDNVMNCQYILCNVQDLTKYEENGIEIKIAGHFIRPDEVKPLKQSLPEITAEYQIDDGIYDYLISMQSSSIACPDHLIEFKEKLSPLGINPYYVKDIIVPDGGMIYSPDDYIKNLDRIDTGKLLTKQQSRQNR